ncbi:hypothetical protein ACFL16_02775 [Patescibacteria group bacterium]
MKKEKLTEKQFILILDGPSCGGKTTAANMILESFGGIFDAQSDRIKWLISDYAADVYRDIVLEMTMEAVKIALKNGMSILRQGAIYGKDEMLEVAREFDVPVFVANISAPKEVLDERFSERIVAKKKGAKISNVDPARFWELCEMHNENKMETPLEFDSSTQSPEEIACAIVRHIQENVK